jgi:hypothetical protein
MSDLHKLVLSVPTGTRAGVVLTLDGQPLTGVQSIVIRGDEESGTFSAVIEFDPIVIEYDGLTDVVGKIIEAPA